MKTILLSLIAGAALLLAVPSLAQPPRQDVIWARSTAGQPLVLDGVLDEPAWAKAEKKIIQYRRDAGVPGSGWKDESGVVLTDSVYAELKFLVVGNQLWLGATVRDSSVGGSITFNEFDGFLMGLKDHSQTSRPAPVAEYLYAFWDQSGIIGNPPPVDMQPVFGGRWATPPWGCCPRTQAQIDAWDARTKVHGHSNTDAVPDTGYTVEMRFDLGVMGYDVTQAQGDNVEWNISIYDCDWRWPRVIGRFGSNRTWWQCPWGNAMAYHQVQIRARPNVTVNSGSLPPVSPDLFILNGANLPAPVVDGNLNDAAWVNAPSIAIRYGDDALRDSYPGVGKWRSGQFQPEVNAGEAAILDPADATVKYFFRGNNVYFGFNVNDQVVQYISDFNRWDGFIIGVQEETREPIDHVLTPRRITFQVGPTGQALKQDYLPFLADTLFGAQVALQLKPGTTVDTVGTSPDAGYTAELSIDLTKLGYPPGLGDHMFYFGIDYLDGDSFTPFTLSYGTRTWWYREYDNATANIVAYLDPQSTVTDVGDPGPGLDFALRGAWPNPFHDSTRLRFSLARASRVGLEVYDVGGRRVSMHDLGIREAGAQEAVFKAHGLSSGLYFYRLNILDPESSSTVRTLSGRMLLVD